MRPILPTLALLLPGVWASSPSLVSQDARKWAEAVGYYQRFAASKDAADRAAGVRGLGEATTEKTDKMCWQLVSAALRQELSREGDGRTEDKVSGLVLDAAVDALRKITQKDAVEMMAKAAKQKGDQPRFRAHIIWALSAKGEIRDLTDLASDPSPHVQIAALDALSQRGDPSSMDFFFRVLRDDKRTWEQKLSALRGIEKAGDEKAIEPLIEGLGKVKTEEGRLKDDYLKILRKLVGVELEADDPNLWRAAWRAKKEGKDPSEPGKNDTVSQPTEFFGLKTKSTRIIFVLDRTGSMGCPLRGQPDPKPALKEPPRKADAGTGAKKEPPEVAAAREEAARIKRKYDEKKVETRIEGLKKEFIHTLWNLSDKVWFNVIFYEANVQPWKDHLVPATWPNKLEIIRETDKLQPSGGTNIWGALEHAYRYVEQPQRPDLIVVDKKGNYATLIDGADTFFLMTDGAHNIGKFVRENAKDPTEACDIPAFIGELRKVNRLRKVVIHAICLGSDATQPELKPDPVLMKKIADETGGEFTQIRG